MSDSILLDGDWVNFEPNFAPAKVVVRPVRLSATGGDPLYGRKMCVEGDESRVVAPDCLYTTPMYPIPGVGTLTIVQLHPTSVARKTTSLGKKVLLKGLFPFIARFQVQAPATSMMTTGLQLRDTYMIYQGSGSFTSAAATKQGE